MVISAINKYNGVLYPSTSSTAQPGSVNGTRNGTAVNITRNGFFGLGRASGASNPAAPVDFISNDPVEAKIMIAMAMSILSGIIQVIMSILHIGFVTKYLSDSIVNGFTCGAAFHVVVSQISTLLGIKLGDTHIPFVLVGVGFLIYIRDVIGVYRTYDNR